MNLRKLTLFLLCHFWLSCAYAGEGGFLNKKNVISTDLYAPIAFGEFGAEYTRVFTSTFAGSISYRQLYQSGNVDYASMSAFRRVIFPLATFANSPVTFFNSGRIIGFKLSFSSSLTGMQLPLGGYGALGLDIIRNSFSEKDLTKNPSRRSYDHKGYFLKLSYGKTTYLTSNFVLDIGIDFGARFGSLDMSGKNFTMPINMYPYRGTSPEGGIPFMDLDGAYFTFGLVPHFKLGYLF